MTNLMPCCRPQSGASASRIKIVCCVRNPRGDCSSARFIAPLTKGAFCIIRPHSLDWSTSARAYSWRELKQLCEPNQPQHGIKWIWAFSVSHWHVFFCSWNARFLPSSLSLSEIFGVLRNWKLYDRVVIFCCRSCRAAEPLAQRVIAGHKYECPLVLARPLPMAKQEWKGCAGPDQIYGAIVRYTGNFICTRYCSANVNIAAPSIAHYLLCIPAAVDGIERAGDAPFES